MGKGKIANIFKMTNHRVKQSEIWGSGIVQ